VTPAENQVTDHHITIDTITCADCREWLGALPDDPKRLPMAAIIMCAGSGKRMQSQSLPKVCSPVAGVPAINRTIHSCRRSGIGAIVVVVGSDGNQVMQTVSAGHAGVLYAHQAEPRGTGHAVRVGFEPLRRMGFTGLVWCLAGDKIVEPGAFREVLSALYTRGADAALAVTEKPNRMDMGRVLQDRDGRVRGIVEGRELRADSPWLTRKDVAEAAASPYRNESVYCFHADALATGLDLLPMPAEVEQYFTDIIAALVHQPHGVSAHIRAALIADPEMVMGFNTPEQLLSVDAAIRKRWKGRAGD